VRSLDTPDRECLTSLPEGSSTRDNAVVFAVTSLAKVGERAIVGPAPSALAIVEGVAQTRRLGSELPAVRVGFAFALVSAG